MRGCLLAAALLAASCGHEPEARPNVLLISIDTLRADHLRCYGYDLRTSPAIDALAARGVRFANNYSQSNQTLPSHASLLTSLFPAEFQITRDDGNNARQQDTKLRLPDAVETLAEVAAKSGYHTGAFTGGGLVAPRYGIGQGFETFEAARSSADQGFDTSLPEFKRWLDDWKAKDDGAPFFAFVHSYDVHDPYHAPPPFDTAFTERRSEDFLAQEGYMPTALELRHNMANPSPEQLDEIRHLYDNGIAYADRGVGLLGLILEESDAWDNTLVVLVSDHGEEFKEHGSWGHGPQLFDELLHVPLIVRFPHDQFAGRVVDQIVRSIDIAPTVAEVIDAPTGAAWKGVSLMELLDGDGEDRPVLSELSNAQIGTTSLRSGDLKVIDVPAIGRELLFDTAADAGERIDLARSRPGALAELRDELRRWRASLAAESKALRAVPMGAEAQNLQELEAELLEKMGYVGD